MIIIKMKGVEVLKQSQEMVTIPKAEYEELKQMVEVDKELLNDIAKGIKDILQGKIKEV